MSGSADDGLPARPRLRTWVMALVRLGAGWLIAARALVLLLAEPSALGASLVLPARLAMAAVLGLGLAAFAWPRSYQWGLALLLGGLAAFELLARSVGLPPTPRLPSALAIVAVLAAGEWLTRRAERRR